MTARAPNGGAAARRSPSFAWVRSLRREPLVAFVLAGALVFAIDHALRRDGATIRITTAVREELARSLQAQLGRPAQPPELQAELERWKEEQALYREGVKMGLRDDDPVVRAHVAGKLLQIAQERTVLPDPTEAELRDFLERHRREYTTPALYDFDQVFFSHAQGDPRARAEEALARLRAGASPEGAGDWFPRGTRFTRESASDIAVLFGVDAAKEVPGFAPGEWHLVQGPTGVHALRVTAVDRGEPDFNRLRPALASGYAAERRDRAAQAYAREIEARYRFVESE
ncbi:MAG: peptidyl-prolyl cis-trans isomerase [Myxococcales bacterium]|nr:peptidyl-prolyl cis-trans isomerase [Myxococcales bacterium]